MMTPCTLDSIIEKLNRFNIEWDFEEPDSAEIFRRTVIFIINDQHYKIVWFCNESTVSIGVKDRAALLPFKYVYIDNTFPLRGGNISLGFAYEHCDGRFNYNCLRIPLCVSEPK